MPIYEYYCEDCHTIFNFFSRRVNTAAQPGCPKCGQGLKRQMSAFATIGRAKEENEEGLPADLDEGKMERVLGELATEAEGVNEDDPKAMARLMRKFTQKTGLDLGGSMEEAMARLEAGEDPEAIEQQMGDVFDGEDPLSMLKKKALKGSRRFEPAHDETLYEL